MRRALTVMSPGPLIICWLRVRVTVPRVPRGTTITVLGAGVGLVVTTTLLTRRFSIVVVPLQIGPFAPHVHRVVDCTVVAVTVIVPLSNDKFRSLTVALDWLEFGVPPAAPPEVLVWMTPVIRLLEVPNGMLAFSTSPCREPPAAGRAPVSATLSLAVIIPRTFALAITPVASPLKLVGVWLICACCVVAITDKNNIAVILSNAAKTILLFIYFLRRNKTLPFMILCISLNYLKFPDREVSK